MQMYGKFEGFPLYIHIYIYLIYIIYNIKYYTYVCIYNTFIYIIHLYI